MRVLHPCLLLLTHNVAAYKENGSYNIGVDFSIFLKLMLIANNAYVKEL